MFEGKTTYVLLQTLFVHTIVSRGTLPMENMLLASTLSGFCKQTAV
jgi:hypothetical protein